MKKIIALLLSVMMIISSMGVVSFAADLTEVTGFDVEDYLQNGDLSSYKILGLSLDKLYNSTDPIFWRTEDEVVGSNQSIDVSYNDVTLLRSNLNDYLRRVVNNLIGGDKLYTSEYATKITNIVGHMLDPNFPEVYVSFNYEREGVDGFYEVIAKRSGLASIIQANWCNRSADVKPFFKPFMEALGVSFEFILLDREYNDGQLMAEKLLKGVIDSIIEKGPLTYFLGLLLKVAPQYTTTFFEPIKGLFNAYLSTGKINDAGEYEPFITESEFRNIKGLFNLISNQNDPADTEHLHFATMPIQRFATAKDITELFLYVMMYTNLIGKDSSNAKPIQNMKDAVANSKKLTDTDKQRLTTFIDAFILGTNLEAGITMVADLLKENISGSLDEIKTGFADAFMSFITSFFRNFVTFFDKIIKSLTHFGEF